MLKIKYYQDDSYSFYKDVIVSKRNTKNNPSFKVDINAISNTQSSYFKVYDEKFFNNSLISIEAAEYTKNDKENLQTLYNYRSKKIQELKNSLTIHPLHKEHILNTCQNCTINEVDTMDHILGQSKFPEFSVHPKNLFPCCSVCNKKKSDNYVDEEGQQLFLNLFLDDLPKSQYLHVEFDKNWLPRFYLKQPEDVSDDLFRLIESHYKRLDLLDRFRDNSNHIISTLKSTIKVFKEENIKEKIEELCLDLEPTLGYNHRQIILYRALGSSKKFIIDCIS
ncbi:hypothetical protein FG135_00365 [Vibrio cholerae]|uniref:hypothetical protein n=3 Tax=Vibrio cholerae TaxID=666 RepID=UPI00084B565F|nr:hypothetical protein [Vibrio cholerae]EGR0656984.1 hypothetical protein [Vibrio cholerae]EGR2831260.1 hypothetical protein [Vibrio cholerae]EJL6415299.1 hypothetical protein [Vibrio cholerae]EMC7821870.1 hypothetical protein [Vibrio cholerae]MBC9067339.1 hypothetical protein [Vibrio cholerae]